MNLRDLVSDTISLNLVGQKKKIFHIFSFRYKSKSFGPTVVFDVIRRKSIKVCVIFDENQRKLIKVLYDFR